MAFFIGRARLGFGELTPSRYLQQPLLVINAGQGPNRTLLSACNSPPIIPREASQAKRRNLWIMAFCPRDRLVTDCHGGGLGRPDRLFCVTQSWQKPQGRVRFWIASYPKSGHQRATRDRQLRLVIFLVLVAQRIRPSHPTISDGPKSVVCLRTVSRPIRLVLGSRTHS
jgi:hypothetical protein